MAVELSIVMPCLNEAETLAGLHPQSSELSSPLGS